MNEQIKKMSNFRTLMKFPHGIFNLKPNLNKKDGLVSLFHLVGGQMESILQIAELAFSG